MERDFAARVLTTPNLDGPAFIQVVTQDKIINDQANNNDGNAEQQLALVDKCFLKQRLCQEKVSNRILEFDHPSGVFH